MQMILFADADLPEPPRPAFSLADFEARYDIWTLYQEGDMHYVQNRELFWYAIERGWLTVSCTTKNAVMYERIK
jgi:hypothetical protein